MNIIEQCIRKGCVATSSDGDNIPCDYPKCDCDCMPNFFKIGVAEFARLTQSPEVVERISAMNELRGTVVRKVLAALFREVVVSGGGR